MFAIMWKMKMPAMMRGALKPRGGLAGIIYTKPLLGMPSFRMLSVDPRQIKPTSRFGEITDQLHVSRRGRIGTILNNSDVSDPQDLKGIVRGMNRVEATTLLKEELTLSKLDASALAGVLLASSAPAQAVENPKELVILSDSGFPSIGRKKRWDALNVELDSLRLTRDAKMQKFNKATESNTTESPHIAYSSVPWKQVKNIIPLSEHTFSGTNICDAHFDTLYSYLKLVSASVKALEGSEAKRMFFIVPIIVAACGSLDDVEFLVEEELKGDQVHALGRFEMIIKKGDKRICIVEAKKEDMEQGLAQCLVGAEVISEQEKLDITYGIITTYSAWYLTSSGDDSIKRDAFYLCMNGTLPERDSLVKLVAKIHSLLTSP